MSGEKQMEAREDASGMGEKSTTKATNEKKCGKIRKTKDLKKD